MRIITYMSDLGDILSKKNLPSEPREFQIIRSFIVERFDVMPRLQLRENSIIISVQGSAVAGSLRFQLPELQSLLETEYQLVIASS